MQEQKHGARSDEAQQVREQIETCGEAQLLVSLEDLSGASRELAAETVREREDENKACAAWVNEMRGKEIQPSYKYSAYRHGDEQDISPVHGKAAVIGAHVTQKKRTGAERTVTGDNGYECKGPGINTVLHGAEQSAQEDEIECLKENAGTLSD
jgi:hypothetical protein